MILKLELLLGGKPKRDHIFCSFSLRNFFSQLASNLIFPAYINAFTLLLNENFAKCFILTLASLLYCSFKLCFVFLLIAFFWYLGSTMVRRLESILPG